MRPIDRFISAVRRGDGDEILFVTGQPIRIRNGANMKVLLAQPVRADQIQAIFQDVVPADVTHGFVADGDATFTFEAPGGPVTVHLRRYQGKLDALVRPAAPGAPTGAQAPSAAPSKHASPTQVGATGVGAGSTSSPPMKRTATPANPAFVPQYPQPGPPQTANVPAAAAQTQTAPLVGAPPGRRQIDPLLLHLIQAKASDLHITANLQPRMRRDGDIEVMPGFESTVLSSDAIRAMLMEIATPVARERFEKSNDCDFAYELPGLARFRVNAFKDRRGVGGVLRVIPSKILTFEDLNLPNVIRDLCSLHKGLVVVTGPTGSGKSTTLAAMVDYINRTRTDHIITIEDPVEFVHETKTCLVNQREVHVDTHSFSAALRAALREDPDIVLVGEMRDLETVSIAIETAETGHLVFGTLHTTTAVSTVDRIIDQFPSDRQAQVRVMLSESLKGVIAQTLCKRQGGGRVAALEILVVNTAVANLIREGKTFQIPSLMQTQKQIGMQTLNDSLFVLVKEGTVAPDDAFAKAVDRTSFKMMLDKAQIKLQ